MPSTCLQRERLQQGQRITSGIPKVFMKLFFLSDFHKK